ncbi:MAG: twitching motility protein PilT [Wujia sp.]
MMLKLVIGAKGTGKTRKMVEMANNESKITSGSIIYIDKSNKHMYELSNVIRLINLHEFNVSGKDSFLGFIQGLISSNHGLTHIFLDNFMWLADIDPAELSDILDEINKISEKYDVIFVISTAVEENEVPAQYKDSIVCVL